MGPARGGSSPGRIQPEITLPCDLEKQLLESRDYLQETTYLVDGERRVWNLLQELFTSFQVDVRFDEVKIEVRAHDVHHRMPKTNYGQYTMVWDRLLGTFRPYTPKHNKHSAKFYTH